MGLSATFHLEACMSNEEISNRETAKDTHSDEVGNGLMKY